MVDPYWLALSQPRPPQVPPPLSGWDVCFPSPSPTMPSIRRSRRRSCALIGRPAAITVPAAGGSATQRRSGLVAEVALAARTCVVASGSSAVSAIFGLAPSPVEPVTGVDVQPATPDVVAPFDPYRGNRSQQSDGVDGQSLQRGVDSRCGLHPGDCIIGDSKTPVTQCGSVGGGDDRGVLYGAERRPYRVEGLPEMVGTPQHTCCGGRVFGGGFAQGAQFGCGEYADVTGLDDEVAIAPRAPAITRRKRTCDGTFELGPLFWQDHDRDRRMPKDLRCSGAEDNLGHWARSA